MGAMEEERDALLRILDTWFGIASAA